MTDRERADLVDELRDAILHLTAGLDVPDQDDQERDHDLLGETDGDD